MTRTELWAYLDDPAGRAAIGRRARALESDGCTGVPNWYRIACELHDIYYRTGRDLGGTPLARAEADRALRWAIQHESPVGRGSPMAWWRYAGVRLLGRPAWRRARGSGP